MLRTLLRPTLREPIKAAVLLCAAAALMVYPQQCMQTVRQGLDLCARTIIPSLFPFFVLSGMVVELGMANYLGKLLKGMMRPLFRVNGAGAAALVLGLVGGYPVGARTAIELYRTGQCSRVETERLLAFCNNSGPAFILGVVGAGVFGSNRAGLALYLVHIAASLCVGVLFRFYDGEEERVNVPVRQPVRTVRFSAAFTDSVRSALTGVLNICAFVVTFAVLIRMLSETGLLGAAARLLSVLGLNAGQGKQLLSGLLEVSSGVAGLEGRGRLTMAAFMLGWAGLSVHCQVLCFLSDSGLRVSAYLIGKALHGGLSALFMAVLSWRFPQTVPAAGWLGQQAEHGMGLHNVFLPVLAAWLIWTVFLVIAAAGEKYEKKGGKVVPIAV